jgi:hypothetical protein
VPFSSALSACASLLDSASSFLRLHQHAHQIARRGVQHADELHHRRLQHEEQLRVELRLARQRASSVTSAGLIARPCTTAALIFSAGAVFMNVVSVLASATGSVPV